MVESARLRTRCRSDGTAPDEYDSDNLAISIVFIIGVRTFGGSSEADSGKWQAVFENIIEMLKDLLQPIVGKSISDDLSAFDRVVYL